MQVCCVDPSEGGHCVPRVCGIGISELRDGLSASSRVMWDGCKQQGNSMESPGSESLAIDVFEMRLADINAVDLAQSNLVDLVRLQELLVAFY